MVVFGPRLREATVLSGKLSGSRTLAGQLRRALFVACVLTVLCSLAPALSSAAQVTLAWDANTEPDLAGYKLYYGNSSGSYQFSVDVGNVTSYTRSGLLDGRIYYFAATTYNLSLAESGFSNEVSKAIADVTPPLVSITAPAAGVTVAGTVTVSANASDNVGVAGVQFKLDGFNLGAEDTVAPYSVSWNTTLATSGSHSLTAVARDAAGNTATSAAVSVTVDNTPPLISTVSASSISSTGAIITWATNEASDSQVDYGLTTAYGSSTPLNSSLLTAHAVTLTGLLATTTYHYRVKSRDAAGNLATSADFTLTTLIAVPDTTPPSVPTNLSASAVSSSQINLSWTASTDNVGVSGYQIYRGGSQIATTSLTSYSDTGLSPSTAYIYTLAAYDAAGSVSAQSAPASAGTLDGACVTSAGSWQNVAFAPQSDSFVVEFDATPNNAAMDGVMGLSNGPAAAYTSLAAIVRFNTSGMIDARNGGAYAASAAIPYSAGTTYHVRLVVSVPAHTYSVYVRSGSDAEQLLASNFSFRTEQALASALNNLGLYTSVGSETVYKLAVTVANDTTPPMVSMTAPAAGSTVAGTVTVSASATDNVGVAGVQFNLDGVNLGAEVTAAPYAISWNTTLAANGSHSLTAVARDTAGNTATTAAVSVTVDNTPPTISLIAPVAGATVAGTVTISASATDNVGVAWVQFKLDGRNLGARVTVAPYSLSWTTTTASDGAHTLTAVARDAAGNTATSAAVSVTVANDTTPPTISLTAPSARATVASTVTIPP